MRVRVKDALKRVFRPEFLNRIDETIIFNKLSGADIEKIAGLMLGEVKKRIEALGIDVSFDSEVVAALAREGFDPVCGARPLRRVIVRRVEDSFSEALLTGEVKPGERVRAVLAEEGIRYKRED